MEIRRALTAGAIGFALLVGGVGCGKVAEKASQKAAEKVIERSSDCEDVELDGSGRVAAECDEGTFEFDGGGGAELPGDWPQELGLPEGARILMSSTSSGTMSVTAGVDGDVDEVAATLTSQLEEAGFTVEDETSTDLGEIRTATVRATGDRYEATVMVGDMAGGDHGDLTLTYSLTPVE